jgi:hypothetical protein
MKPTENPWLTKTAMTMEQTRLSYSALADSIKQTQTQHRSVSALVLTKPSISMNK